MKSFMSAKTMKLLPTFLENKYTIAVLVFFIWMLFFDRNNMINQYRLISNRNGLNRTKEFYIQEMKADSAALQTLLDNEKELEKFAREKYLMKRDDEDIYLIIRK